MIDYLLGFKPIPALPERKHIRSIRAKSNNLDHLPQGDDSPREVRIGRILWAMRTDTDGSGLSAADISELTGLSAKRVNYDLEALMRAHEVKTLVVRERNMKRRLWFGKETAMTALQRAHTPYTRQTKQPA